MYRRRAYRGLAHHAVRQLLEGGWTTVQRREEGADLRAIVMRNAVAIGVGSLDDWLRTGIVGVRCLGEVAVGEEALAGDQDCPADRCFAAFVLVFGERTTRMQLGLDMDQCVRSGVRQGADYTFAMSGPRKPAPYRRNMMSGHERCKGRYVRSSTAETATSCGRSLLAETAVDTPALYERA